MPKNYLQAAIEIAREAGQILREEFARPAQISYKGDEVDLVTQADKRSEAAIIIRYRAEHGHFKSIEDLKKVPDIDVAKIEAKKDSLVF